jgi:hypothetical protein
MALAYQPPVSDENGPLVIRPSWKSLGRWELHIAVLALFAVALASAKFLSRGIHGPLLLLLPGMFAVFFGAYTLYLTLYMLGTSITVTTDSILVTHWFGSTATVPITDIAQVINCRLNESRGRNSGWPRPAVLALSSTGKCVLSLWAERWNPADLDRIWRHLGVPTQSWIEIIRVRDLRKRFPGAF